jgi:hypothetical protein
MFMEQAKRKGCSPRSNPLQTEAAMLDRCKAEKERLKAIKRRLDAMKEIVISDEAQGQRVPMGEIEEMSTEAESICAQLSAIEEELTLPRPN